MSCLLLQPRKASSCSNKTPSVAGLRTFSFISSKVAEMVVRSTPMTSSVSSDLSFSETLTLVSVFLASVGIIANTFHGDGEPLIASLAFSGIAFSATYAMIRWLGPTFMKAGLKGKDMSKVNKKEIPETMGAICAVVYMLIIICFIPFPFYKDIVAATSGGGNRDVVIGVDIVQTGRFLHRFPHSKVRSINMLQRLRQVLCGSAVINWLKLDIFSPGKYILIKAS
jgi:hypothetical protein